MTSSPGGLQPSAGWIHGPPSGRHSPTVRPAVGDVGGERIGELQVEVGRAPVAPAPGGGEHRPRDQRPPAVHLLGLAVSGHRGGTSAKLRTAPPKTLTWSVVWLALVPRR